MNDLVTEDVVTDLWLLAQAGEASADSQTLVRTYVASRPELRNRLEAGQHLPALRPLRLSPSVEMQALENAREKARNKMILIGLAMAFVSVTAMAALGGALFLAMTRW